MKNYVHSSIAKGECPGVTNKGGDDGDARLAVAEGVVLRDASVRETTNEAATAVGGT